MKKLSLYKVSCFAKDTEYKISCSVPAKEVAIKGNGVKILEITTK